MGNQAQQAYFESIYRETFRRLSQYVFLKSPSAAAAEDVVATVYMDFYQYVVLHDRQPDNVLAYLTRMANHELSRLYRAPQPPLSLDDAGLNLGETIPDDTDVELAVFDRFAAEALWQAVGRLSQPEQQALVARIRFEMPFPEIARTLGQNESAVKLRYYRSLDKLKRLLDERPKPADTAGAARSGREPGAGGASGASGTAGTAVTSEAAGATGTGDPGRPAPEKPPAKISRKIFG